MNWFDFAMTARPLELVWMTAIFAYIAWRALSPRRRASHSQNAMIPLRDEMSVEPSGTSSRPYPENRQELGGTR